MKRRVALRNFFSENSINFFSINASSFYKSGLGDILEFARRGNNDRCKRYLAAQGFEIRFI